ncbi:Protein of unknown function [Bacillus cereus]|nr:Protein of unknown function [Bacillus cereus]
MMNKLVDNGYGVKG